ncbi:hypothetical protein Kfla_5633 [Kribbella flavida DSM 17836]|uniref:Uncharacterized protein n=1 Tax=Kribbella flavida (strain DSM 17836 / JCM 10339 / NBRC 14399) TaxID=479435 RepID=D2PP43_KRIFD|nr:hypothetical protein [Kribbella flavida]ADB34639.1 hypothetical protein Kfla_5633 [Kribbella flavida DSM 17836]
MPGQRPPAPTVLAPFLAEHYAATGQDLTALAATDQKLLALARVYAGLPGIAEEIAETTIRPDTARRQARIRHLYHQANDMLNDTAVAIRHRLTVLARRHNLRAR